MYAPIRMTPAPATDAVLSRVGLLTSSDADIRRVLYYVHQKETDNRFLGCMGTRWGDFLCVYRHVLIVCRPSRDFSLAFGSGFGCVSRVA